MLKGAVPVLVCLGLFVGVVKFIVFVRARWAKAA